MVKLWVILFCFAFSMCSPVCSEIGDSLVAAKEILTTTTQKIYVKPSEILFSKDKIFIHKETDQGIVLIEVSSIQTDCEGIYYTIESPSTDENEPRLWRCRMCESINLDSNKYCQTCGRPRS